jgi:hypothetical protein
MRHIPIFIALVATITAAHAAPATLEGSWRGTGIVTYARGADRVDCRVRYTRGGAGRYLVTSHCATESGSYDLSGAVVSVGGNRYTGFVGSGGQRGRVALVQRGDRLEVTVTSRRGTARLSLTRS